MNPYHPIVVSSAEKNNIIAIKLILLFKPWKHH
jgi:hypothetical protein